MHREVYYYTVGFSASCECNILYSIFILSTSENIRCYGRHSKETEFIFILSTSENIRCYGRHSKKQSLVLDSMFDFNS